MEDLQFFFLMHSSSLRVLYHYGVNIADEEDESLSLVSLTDFISSLVHFFLNFSTSELKSIELNVCRITLVRRDDLIFGLMSGFAIPSLDAEFKLNTIVSLILAEKEKFFSRNDVNAADDAVVVLEDEITHLVEQVLLGNVIELSSNLKKDISKLVEQWCSSFDIPVTPSVTILSFSGSVLIDNDSESEVIHDGQDILGIIHSLGIVDLDYFVLSTQSYFLVIHGITSGIVLLVKVKDLPGSCTERDVLRQISELSMKIRETIG